MTEPSAFKCPHCGADYHVFKLKVDAPLEAPLGCLICDERMPSCESQFILKYFLVSAPRRPRTRARYVGMEAVGSLAPVLQTS
jgi:hypothetical protein